jgi:glycosyltransferase involved in cell wall biosynthesis
MAMGIPVVASPQAAKGIDAVPERDLLVAEDTESFAKQVIHLLENRNMGNRLSEAALKQVKTAHRWSTSMGTLDRIVAAASSTENWSLVL